MGKYRPISLENQTVMEAINAGTSCWVISFGGSQLRIAEIGLLLHAESATT